MVRIASILGTLAIVAQAAQAQSGKAKVDWITAGQTYQPGTPVTTGLRMVLDPNWHTYWINPGEGGMPMSVNFTLPDGWKTVGPSHPLPIRFKTGDLFDFGYEGTVVFPIVLHPPADASGAVEIQAKVSWLACDASACIPGDASVTLALRPGAPSPTPEAGIIDAAIQTVPIPAAAPWKLVAETDGNLIALRLSPPTGLDPEKSTTFPLTPELIHPSAVFAWTTEAGAWTCRVPKSPYAPEALRKLELVVHEPTLKTPVIVTWTAD